MVAVRGYGAGGGVSLRQAGLDYCLALDTLHVDCDGWMSVHLPHYEIEAKAGYVKSFGGSFRGMC